MPSLDRMQKEASVETFTLEDEIEESRDDFSRTKIFTHKRCKLDFLRLDYDVLRDIRSNGFVRTVVDGLQRHLLECPALSINSSTLRMRVPVPPRITVRDWEETEKEIKLKQKDPNLRYVKVKRRKS